MKIYRGADKSLAPPTSIYSLFDGENISFDASLVIYINSTNIPPIMIINRIYGHQNLSLKLFFFLVGLRTYQHPCILLSVACPAVQYFCTLSHKQHDFRGKKPLTEHKMCVLIFSTSFVGKKNSDYRKK